MLSHLHHTTERRAAHLVCRLLLFAFLAGAVAGCTCNNNTRQDAETELTQEQEVAKILENCADFDAQQMHEYALLTERKDLDPVQLAGMTAMSESALNKVEAQLEYLLRNDDAADSHAVLTEWADTQWVKDFAVVLAYLKRTPIPEGIKARAQTLVKASERLNTLANQIESTQLNGKSTGFRF